MTITSKLLSETRCTRLPVPAECIQAMAVGHLTGNGNLDTVLRYAAYGTIHIAAIAHTGATLWSYDTGLPARGGWDGGGNHVPFVCWDFTGDGYDSVAVHTAGDAWSGAADAMYTIGKPAKVILMEEPD